MLRTTRKPIDAIGKRFSSYRRYARQLLSGGLMALLSFSALAATPLDQNFDAKVPRIMTSSGDTIDGATYRLVSPASGGMTLFTDVNFGIAEGGSDNGVMFNCDEFCTIQLGALDARISSADGTEFRIVSMEVDTGLYGTSTNLTVTGYRNNVPVASDTINTSVSDASGSVTYARMGGIFRRHPDL